MERTRGAAPDPEHGTRTSRRCECRTGGAGRGRGRYDDAMDHADPAASRLEALEVKVAFMDDLLDHLNALVARQQGQIDRLTAEVRRLAAQQPEPGVARSLRDELPPHW